MGVNITDLLVRKELQLDSLAGKVIAADAHLFLYQFITTIRQPDGTPLMDSKGNITSHLSGLFSRSARLMEKGVKLVYVFDGKAPELKAEERERRKQLKQDAKIKYEEAVESHDLTAMKKFAGRTAHLTREMIEESKALIRALGLPVIEAPSEGEAQAAQLVKEGLAYAVASQDADSLMFGTPRLIRNISIAGKRKKANKVAYETVEPELVDLQETLSSLGISQSQLIVLGMLVGTDFNQGGIKGIGPKNALKLVKKHGDNFDALFKEANWQFPRGWQEIYAVFSEMPVKKDIQLSWAPPNIEQVKRLLVDNHEFSEERVLSTLQKLAEQKGKAAQKGLGDFFH
ncbi:MAG: flap endonuclease-1 [Nanoarchaeota archaeon]|nr:flap endonuclease-1 [Nanoarchaeota archaeon]